MTKRGLGQSDAIWGHQRPKGPINACMLIVILRVAAIGHAVILARQEGEAAVLEQ